MDKQQALQHFYEHHYLPLLEIQMETLEAEFHHGKAQFISNFTASFQKLCSHILRMQQQGEKEPIAYIHYSFLRTQILEQSCLYMVEAYSGKWYEDQADCRLSYDASWVYTHFTTMLEALEQERKKYMGVLSPADIERLMLESTPFFHQFVSSIMRLAITEAVQTPEYQAIHKAGRLLIRTGEFRDISENLYVEDQKNANTDAVREQLTQAGKEESYIYENIKNLSLPHLHLIEKDLRYNDFSYSDLRGSQFHACVLIGSRWQQTNVEGGSFQGCLLSDADFRYSDLKGANFRGASGQAYRDHGLRVPGLCGLRFEHANLDEADFTDIHSFEHAYFEGASMHGTKIPLKYQQQWKLSDIQRQSIVWTE
ncbi:pentapeptide repeat-containing protein [Paenibacillus durus]|uniref:Pentapeptide repeat-containing protein n=1 Tax=Paenibacillus durus TaxID=44251 RepID=A0A089HJV8_PAEDU|nr:pentapeptide repeat-containing protein [Paenibacillus durus]AIQ11377.1 hypothetical protein PDUR_04785 [Paenibacillus durus]